MTTHGRLVGTGTLARSLGVSTSTVRNYTDAGVLPAEKTAGGHRRYDLEGAHRAWAAHNAAPGASSTPASSRGCPGESTDDTFAIRGLHENEVWQQLQPKVGLDGLSEATQVAQYALTEMLNNAIDHSHGTQVIVRTCRHDDGLWIDIEDDGNGAFHTVATSLKLESLYEAIGELSKGRVTSAPDTHSGEGIFFTSKAVDVFTLESNGLTWIVDNVRQDVAVGTSTTNRGTRIHLEIRAHPRRSLHAVFAEFTLDHEFARTRPSVKLFEYGVTFVSRSEAKRLLSGLEKFQEVEMDFTAVESVGQGFVDEVFRVWRANHPETLLIATNMNPAVDFMVSRGIATSR